MLAASSPEDLSLLRYPVLATPKLDGIRCVTLDGVSEFKDGQCLPVCRSLKPVPSDMIRRQLSLLPPGLDGELITYEEQDLIRTQLIRRPFNRVQSDIMSTLSTPNFRYHIFDSGFLSDRKWPYVDRVLALSSLELPAWCLKFIPVECESAEALQEYEEQCVSEGYEGICHRTIDSPYKHGRSTLREQWLVKMKRFVTAEAGVIGTYELMGNNNPMTYNMLGHAERSSHKANMVGKGVLGGLLLRLPDGREFGVGTGFDSTQRRDLWLQRDSLIGKTVTFKHQPHGAKDLPRTPVFVGFRDDRDL